MLMGQVPFQLLVYCDLFQAFREQMIGYPTKPIAHIGLERMRHRKHSIIARPSLCQMETACSVWEDPSDPALVWMADIKPFAEYYF